MKELVSLDLFSGIGGLTLALEGVVRPVAYCDAADGPKRVLAARIADGSLPAAPICEDVHVLKKGWLRLHAPGAKPNTVVAGFPCVGFSCAGRREGFHNEQSALFFELLRIVDEFHIKAVFMENVPEILRSGMQTVVDEFTRKRRFELRWCLLSACDVGAPHKRTRWYSVALRQGVRVPQFRPLIHAVDWDSEPVRMITRRCDRYLERMRLLGNSVVPQAARHAYASMLAPRFQADSQSNVAQYPRCGIALPPGDTILAASLLSPVTRRQLDLCLLPDAYTTGKPASDQQTTEVCRDPVHISLWATPTSGRQGAAPDAATL